MNRIQSANDPAILLDLKYCERCGGLFLRPMSNLTVYCVLCSNYFAARPDPGAPPPSKPRRRKVRLPSTQAAAESRRAPAQLNLPSLQGVAALELHTTEVRP